MKKLLLILLSISLISCAARKAVPVAHMKTIFPSIGTTATAGIGEPLLTSGDGEIIPVLEIPQDQQIGDFVIHKGKYEQKKQNAEYTTFSAVAMTSKLDGKFRKDDVYLFAKDAEGKTLCTSRKNCGVVDYVKTTLTRSNTASFQQTLFYNGKVGNRINLAYREFSNSMARTAFSNEVSYDLSESTTLGYRGARLEIIKATNTELTYKILTDFN